MTATRSAGLWRRVTSATASLGRKVPDCRAGLPGRRALLHVHTYVPLQAVTCRGGGVSCLFEGRDGREGEASVFPSLSSSIFSFACLSLLGSPYVHGVQYSRCLDRPILLLVGRRVWSDTEAKRRRKCTVETTSLRTRPLAGPAHVEEEESEAQTCFFSDLDGPNPDGVASRVAPPGRARRQRKLTASEREELCYETTRGRTRWDRRRGEGVALSQPVSCALHGDRGGAETNTERQDGDDVYRL